MEYVAHILVNVGLFAVLSLSLNLLVGYTGLVSLAHAGFFAIGAYASALMTKDVSDSYPLALAVAMISAGAVASVFGRLLSSVSGDYYVIATYAVSFLVFSAANNLDSLTGGPGGISAIPPPRFLQWSASSTWHFLVLSMFLLLCTWIILHRAVEAPFGKVLKAIREDELLVATLGKNPARYKLIAFVLSASLAGAAGSLFAPFMTFIDPSSFTVSDSMILLTVVIVGGTASLGGSVAGAIVLVTLPELLRFLGIPSAAAASIRQIIYGLTLIAMMIWRPKGLCGEATLQSRS